MRPRISFLWTVPVVFLGASGASIACTDNGASVQGTTFGPLPRSDAGRDAEPADEAPDGGDGDSGDDATTPCAAGTLALLAGSDAALTAATQTKGGAWSATTFASGVAKSAPALVANGTGFVGVVRSGGDVLASVRFDGTWKGPASIGSATTLGTPSLAVQGASTRAVYLSAAAASTHKFFIAEDYGDGWDDGSTPVGPAGAQSFSAAPGSLAAIGEELTFLQTGGDNNGLFVQARAAGVWSAGTGIVGVGTTNTIAPRLLAMAPTPNAPADLVALYVAASTQIGAATRDSASKTWTDRASIAGGLATTSESFDAAPIGASIVVTFRGQDGNGYLAKGTPGAAGIAWGAATPIGGTPVAVDGAPAVTRGVCGDDLAVAYASGGVVRLVRLRGATWTAAEPVAGVSGSRLALASRD